jgi:hypothetical protein
MTMSATAFRETTSPLLTPEQVLGYQQEEADLQRTLSAPPHIRKQIQNAGAMADRLRQVKRLMEQTAPKAYAPQERDGAAARLRELEAQITAGMPTQEEMRRNPPGAVDKHMAWEKRNKRAILEWKNIRRRMHMTEIGNGQVEAARDISNIEMLRPHGLTQSMDMAGAQIQGKHFFMPDRVQTATVFSDAEIATVRGIDPALADQIALMTPEQREALKEALGGVQAAPQGRAARRPMTPEQRKAAGERLKAAKAAKKAAQAG